MRLHSAFVPTPLSPSTPRHQLDSHQNVFLSIRAPTPFTSSPSAPAPTLSTADAIKAESLSPSLAPSPTRTSTPSSSSSLSLSSPLSPLSTSSPSHKRHHSLISPSPPTPPSNPSPPSAPQPPPTKRAKGAPRGTKGLRYFSILVCQKLSECQCSTYNHIADVLIGESRKPVKGDVEGEGEEHFDEKNIRRRIYDALNVLMAINFIVKDKKVIRWNGGQLPPLLSPLTPTSSIGAALPLSTEPTPHEVVVRLRGEHGVLQARVNEKKALLTEQVLEYVGMRSLLERNAEVEGGVGGEEDVRLYFPFILVNTNKTTTIDCEMSERHDAVSMRYSDVFSVHDQAVVVRMLGKGRERLWENIPKELQGLVVGLEEAKRESEERAREARGNRQGDMESDEEQDDQPGGKKEEDEGEDGSDGADDEQGSGLEKAPLEDDDPYSRLPHPGSLYPLSSSLSFSHRSSSHFALQSPSHSSMAALLSTPMKPAGYSPFPSPLIKHLSPLASPSPYPPLYPSLFSPHVPSLPHLPSPLPLHSLSSLTPSPLPALGGRGGVSRQPSSSSRLFGGGEGVRRTGSVVIGNSGSIIISSDGASGLSSPQITVS